MSWIKDNQFTVTLGGATLVGAIVIFVLGSREGSLYQQAKDDFETTAAEGANYEKLALYPSSVNCDGKTKALADYREATASLQKAFAKYRPQELKNVSPQDFTNSLKALNDEVRKACETAGTKVPDTFFCGFENYKTGMARSNATGMLNYQLGAMKGLMLALAESGVSELKNIYRPLLAEENGKAETPKATDVARPLPLEITFSGPEKAVRAYLSAILKLPDYYVVIRSIAVENTKKDPPRASDAKFEKATSPDAAAGGEAGFGNAFVLPDEPKAPATPAAPGAAPGAAAAPAAVPHAEPADTSRILAQVLGKEEVRVFLRLDILQFLPAQKLP